MDRIFWPQFDTESSFSSYSLGYFVFFVANSSLYQKRGDRMNTLKRFKSKKGTSAVEAVIILPILVLLTFGGLKYGLLFLRAQQITNVARQACRLAIRPYSDNDDVEAEILRLMTAIGLEDYYSVQMPEDITLAPSGSMSVGQELELRVIVSTDRIDKLTLVNWLPLPEEIGGEVTMSKEGPS
jgi:hypothetical protein